MAIPLLRSFVSSPASCPGAGEFFCRPFAPGRESTHARPGYFFSRLSLPSGRAGPECLTPARLILTLIAMVMAVAGCTDKITAQAITGIQNQEKISVANINAAAEKAKSAAEANPAAHPIQAGENVAAGIRKPSILIAFVALVAIGVFVGLKFTALSPISAIGLPVAIGVFAVTFCGAVILPWLLNPIAQIVGLVCAGAFGLYEVLINKKAIESLISTIESDLKPKLAIVTNAVSQISPPAIQASLPATAVSPPVTSSA